VPTADAQWPGLHRWHLRRPRRRHMDRYQGTLQNLIIPGRVSCCRGTPPGGMHMELTDSLKLLFIETATTLKGSARRLFLARPVKELGPGGQRRAERELGWNRETIRK